MGKVLRSRTAHPHANKCAASTFSMRLRLQPVIILKKQSKSKFIRHEKYCENSGGSY